MLWRFKCKVLLWQPYKHLRLSSPSTLHTLLIPSIKSQGFKNSTYRVRQKYLTILQHNCEWNCWCGEFVFERPTSETQSISVAMERWSVKHRAFAVETYLKNNDSVVLTQRICLRHFNIHRNNSVPSRNTLLLWVRNFRETASAAKRKSLSKRAFT